MPTNITTTPIRNNQPNVGKNNTSNMPTPNPIKHTPNVFFKIFIMGKNGIECDSEKVRETVYGEIDTLEKKYKKY